MKKIRSKHLKKSIFWSVIPKSLLTNEELALIKGGVSVMCYGSGETLRASDFPGADDYYCNNGATLTPKVGGSDPIGGKSAFQP